MLNKDYISNWFMVLQDNICQKLTEEDQHGFFKEDKWERKEGGGGRTRIMNNGRIIEKGGVNFSAVYGAMPEKISTALGIPQGEFFATGVSIVLHPHSPMMPIIHMNVRYFELENNIYWFGGGIDLTPHYVDASDAIFFHQQLKNVCDKHHPDYYPDFKKWADDYFYIKHRQETRGIGGIFFDRLADKDDIDKSKRFAFVQDVGNAFAPIYTYYMKKNFAIPFDEKEKNWQMLRRGRYVEFNLIYDKGTKFGLDTDGRTESILMSMPPIAKWVYDFKPEDNSPESYTLSMLKKGINWV
ncbi:MAG: oxygen-dependent coproporphyrinogen oxidase [Flammeovirgaceae bacterium]